MPSPIKERLPNVLMDAECPTDLLMDVNVPPPPPPDPSHPQDFFNAANNAALDPESLQDCAVDPNVLPALPPLLLSPQDNMNEMNNVEFDSGAMHPFEGDDPNKNTPESSMAMNLPQKVHCFVEWTR